MYTLATALLCETCEPQTEKASQSTTQPTCPKQLDEVSEHNAITHL